MINGIRIQQRGGDFRFIDLPLNSKQMQLALDKSNGNKSWDLLCDSIKQMYGIMIIGNYNLDSIFINGVQSPLH